MSLGTPQSVNGRLPTGRASTIKADWDQGVEATGTIEYHDSSYLMITPGSLIRVRLDVLARPHWFHRRQYVDLPPMDIMLGVVEDKEVELDLGLLYLWMLTLCPISASFPISNIR